MIDKIRKRDGRIVKFDKDRIANAIFKAAKAVGGKDYELAKKLANDVVELLNKRLKEGEIPTVEMVQDIVEKVLVEGGHYKTAKAYILYRKQHEEIRRFKDLFSNVEVIENYLNLNDWRVKENANMTFSLQGLNFHVSSIVTSQFWLNKIYPPEIKKAHLEGDFHIHDLGILGVYCVGWDLYDLLLSGFRGVRGKIESKPPKHFRSALGQIVNFFFTLQGEAAGAIAFSNFDTLLAPFIRYDNLNYRQVKQALQEFVFNVNVPTRVGFQCLSEDTKILTPRGWKSYNQVREGDLIYTFNLKTGKIEKKKVNFVFKKFYRGHMYNLKNRNQNQLVSPGHRVVRRSFNSNKYFLQVVEELLNFKAPILIPVSGKNKNRNLPISENQIKLIAWTLSKGSIEKSGSHRVSIYQSQFSYTERLQQGFGLCNHLRLSPSSSKVALSWFNEEKIPEFLFEMSEKQAKIFLETYIKGDGWEEKYGKRIVTTDKEIAEFIAGIAVLAGYNCNIKERIPKSEHSKKLQYIVTLTKSKHDYIKEIRKVYYEGIIWSVHTENETVIAMRDGQVFITGNTPFTNITLDLTVLGHLKNQAVIIGGEPQNKTYGDFQKEVNLFNNALAEIMSEGDANNRVFTFPIPTYNITKDFDFENVDYEKIFEMTAKYGIPYFANFVNSDMKPDDVRSMCCRLRLNTKVLKKRGGGLFGANPLTGSIGVVTINMPRLGFLSKTEEEFFERLEKLMVLAKNSLEIKRKILENLTEKGLYPYSKFYLRNVKKRFGRYWQNHFSTIGLIGMNEACLNFLNCTIGEKEGLKFAEKVMDFMRNKLLEFQEETGNNYNLEATPAEGTSYRLARIDKGVFPEIRVANEEEAKRGAEPYYTNSTQLPVNFTDDIFEVLRLQDSLQTRYSGGTVIHIFLGEKKPPVDSVKTLVRKICENFRLPYFTITPTFSICPHHGYIFGEHFSCPKCKVEGREMKCEVYSRIVGYLRPVEQWNAGKQEEFKQRKTFDKSIK